MALVVAVLTQVPVAGEVPGPRLLYFRVDDIDAEHARGVPTVTGARWSTRTIRDILLRRRNVGLVVHRGEVLEGLSAPWEPILSRDVWDAVRALLTDPSRRTSPGNTPRWLGSGLYRCGHPDCIDADPPVTMRVGVTGGRGHRQPSYGCSVHRHLTRAAHTLDDYVGRVLVHRLERPDAADLLVVPDHGVDTGALARDAAALRTRIREAGDLWEDGTLSAAEYRHARPAWRSAWRPWRRSSAWQLAVTRWRGSRAAPMPRRCGSASTLAASGRS